LPPPDGAPPAPAAAAPRSPATGLAAFEARQRDAAEAASRQGRWSEAVWSWDVLRALRPNDAEVASRRRQAQKAAETAAAERLPKARQAQQRGDNESATRLFLEVLALAPGTAEAADGLRAIEAERVKRQHLGQLSRNTLMRRPAADAPSTPSTGMPGSGRNEVEHASMLAAQGEVDGAIAVLTAAPGTRRNDPMARSLLADLYYRQAEGLVATDLPAALAALERSVQTDPTHPRAAARLRQLRDPVKASPIPPRGAPRRE
jgi:tetratricopeptide (TPR) repeat protein